MNFSFFNQMDFETFRQLDKADTFSYLSIIRILVILDDESATFYLVNMSLYSSIQDYIDTVNK